MHLDLKTANVLVGMRDGRRSPKISDFGASFRTLRSKFSKHMSLPVATCGSRSDDAFRNSVGRCKLNLS